MIKENSFYEDLENDRILKVVNINTFSSLCISYPIYWCDDECYSVDHDNWDYVSVTPSKLNKLNEL